MPIVPKIALKNVGKPFVTRAFCSAQIFQGVILFNSEPTTLLQIFCKFRRNSRVIHRNMIGPDNKCKENFQARMGHTMR